MATGGNAIRGTRVGAGPMGEQDHGHHADRLAVSYWDALGNETVRYFAAWIAEEEIPEVGAPSPRSEKSVHVDEESSIGHDAEEELAGMSPEEREKHRKFEQLRKRHYEMKNVAQLLGHPDDLPEDEDDEDDGTSTAGTQRLCVEGCYNGRNTIRIADWLGRH